jgi:hypothetical protein
MENIDLLTQTVETEGYELHLEDYLRFEWYAAQLELTVDYFLDEFFIDDTLIIPPGLVDYNYEEEEAN